MDATSEKTVGKGAADAVKRSLWVFLCNAGSCNGCDIENVAMVTPRYDVERLGIKVVGSPRHADALLVTGPVTRKMAHWLKRAYDQMPESKVVVAVRIIQDDRRMFLPEDFPEGVYPWRRDETGVQGMTRELWSEGRPAAEPVVPNPVESQKSEVECPAGQEVPAKEMPVTPDAGESPAPPAGAPADAG